MTPSYRVLLTVVDVHASQVLAVERYIVTQSAPGRILRLVAESAADANGCRGQDVVAGSGSSGPASIATRESSSTDLALALNVRDTAPRSRATRRRAPASRQERRCRHEAQGAVPAAS